jgi:hypothetical protein
LREVVCPVLKLREEKWTFVIVGGGKIDFFLSFIVAAYVVCSLGFILQWVYQGFGFDKGP